MLEFLRKYSKWITVIKKKEFGDNFYLAVSFIDGWRNVDMEIPLLEDISDLKEDDEYTWLMFEEVLKNGK